MDASDPWVIFFFIIATVSIICTLFVLTHIYLTQKFTDNRVSLLFLLHFTVLMEDITNLPLAWVNPLWLCQIFGWLHFYTGLCNLIVISFMSFYYFSYLNLENYSSSINKFIHKYSFSIIFGFPLITVLPFSTSSYAISGGMWCTLPSGSRVSNNWAIGVFYVWAFLFSLSSMFQYAYTRYRFIRYKLPLGNRLSLSVGSYIIVSIFCWFPRIIPRFVHFFMYYTSSNLLVLLTTLPLYVSGILYSFIYVLGLVYLDDNRTDSRADSTGNLSSFQISNLEGILAETNSSFESKEASASENKRSTHNNNPMHRSSNLEIA
jgi:hypothetical protein